MGFGLWDALGEIGHQLDSAVEQFGEVTTDVGKTLNINDAAGDTWKKTGAPLLRNYEPAYRGITRPITTLILADYDGDWHFDFGKGWKESRNISPGQALYMTLGKQADDMANQWFGIDDPLEWASKIPVFGDDIEQSYEEVTGSGGAPGFDPWNAEQRKAVFDHGFAQFYSGVHDFAARWYLDPLIVGGKAIKIGKLGGITRPLVYSGTDKFSTKLGARLGGASPLGSDAAINRINEITSGISDTRDAQRFEAWAKKYMDIESKARRTVLLMRDPIMRGKSDQAAIIGAADDLEQFRRRVAIAMDPRFTSKVEADENLERIIQERRVVTDVRLAPLQAELRRITNGWLDTPIGIDKEYFTVTLRAATALHVEARALGKEKELAQLMASTSGKMNVVPHVTLGQKIGSKVEKGLTARAAERTGQADHAPVDWYIYQPGARSGLRILKSASTTRAGNIDHNIPSSAGEQIANMFNRLGHGTGRGISSTISAAHIAAVNWAAHTGSSADLTNAIQRAEEVVVRHIAEQHNVPENVAVRLAKEYRERRVKVTETFANPRGAGVSSAAKDVERDAAGQPLQTAPTQPVYSAAQYGGVFVDELRNVNGVIERHPNFNAQMANQTPLLDVDGVTKFIAREAKTLRHEGDDFMKALDTGRTAASETVNNALDTLNRFWKPAQLLRLGWPARVLIDENMRAMALMGSLAHLSMSGQSLGNSIYHGSQKVLKLRDLAGRGRRRNALKQLEALGIRPKDGDFLGGEWAQALLRMEEAGATLRRAGRPDLPSSKVRGPDGKLLDVHHGRRDPTDEFSDARIGSQTDVGWFGQGHYFAENEAYARTYPLHMQGIGNNVIRAYLDIHNPFLYRTHELTPEDIEEIARASGLWGPRPHSPRDDAWATDQGLHSEAEANDPASYGLTEADFAPGGEYHTPAAATGTPVGGPFNAGADPWADAVPAHDYDPTAGAPPYGTPPGITVTHPPEGTPLPPGYDQHGGVTAAQNAAWHDWLDEVEAADGPHGHGGEVGPPPYGTPPNWVAHSHNVPRWITTPRPMNLEELLAHMDDNGPRTMNDLFVAMAPYINSRDFHFASGDWMKAKGYDGVKHTESEAGFVDQPAWVAFRANQIHVTLGEGELDRLRAAQADEQHLLDTTPMGVIDQLEWNLREKAQLDTDFDLAHQDLNNLRRQIDDIPDHLEEAGDMVRALRRSEFLAERHLRELNGHRLDQAALHHDLTGRREALNKWGEDTEAKYKSLVQATRKPSEMRRGERDRPNKFGGTRTFTSGSVVHHYNDAFGGDYGPMHIDLVSSASIARAYANIQNEGLGLLRISAGDTTTLTGIIPKDATTKMARLMKETYDRGWERAVNEQIGLDPMTRMMLQGKTDDEITRWMRTTVDGAAYYDKGDKVRRANLDYWVGAARVHVDHYLPPEYEGLRELALKGRATTDDLRKWNKTLGGDDPANLPTIHAQSLNEVISGTAVGKHWANFVDNAYRYIGTAPTDVLSRQPLFAAVYRKEMQRKFESFGLKGDERVPEHMIAAMERDARKEALAVIKRTLYDVANESNLSHAVRFIMPFYAAWQDALQTWGRLVMDDPAVLGKMMQAWQAPSKSGTVYTSPTGDKYINVPLPKFMKDLPVIKSMIPMGEEAGMPADALRSLIFQGDYWYMPGFGPPVTLPISKLVRERPDLYTLMKPVIPFGAGDGYLDTILPAGWKRMASLNNEEDDADYAKALVRSAQDVYTDRRLGKNEYTDLEMWNEAKRRTNSLFTVRMASNFGLPFSPSFRSPYQTYVDAYSTMSEQYRKDKQAFGGLEPQDAFLDKYGEEYMAFTLAATKSNIGGIAPTEAGFTGFEKYQDLVREAPEMGSLIVGDSTGEYSASVAQWMTDKNIGAGDKRKLREVRDPKEMQEDIETNRGWAKFRALDSSIDATLYERGLRTINAGQAADLKAMRDAGVAQIMADYPAWAVEFGRFDRGTADRRKDVLEKLVEDPRMADRPGWSSLREYLAYRRLVVTELAARPSQNMQAESNRDIKLRFESVVTGLKLSDTYFADIHARWLAGDTLK